jgi:hypothetical protein
MKIPPVEVEEGRTDGQTERKCYKIMDWINISREEVYQKNIQVQQF